MTMSGTIRLLSLFCLISTAFGLTNTSTAVTSSPTPPGDGAVVLQPNKMGIAGLPIPNIISSLLAPKPSITPVASQPASIVPQVTSFIPQSTSATPVAPITQQNGGSGPIAGLLSALGGLLPSLTNIVPPVPTTDNGDALGELLSALGGVLGPLTQLPNGIPPVPTMTAPPSPKQPAGGDSGVLGALLSAIDPVLSALTGIPNVATSAINPAAIPASAIVPLEPLLTVLSQILSASLDLGDIATALPDDLPPLIPALTAIPALISEILPEIPQMSTELPALMPLLDALEEILSPLAPLVPDVAILTSAIAAEVTALAGHTFSGNLLTVTQLPILTVDLSSTAIPVPLPTDMISELQGLPLPSKVPLSELSASLANLVGPENTELVQEIVGALASTLDSMVLISEIHSLAEVTVAGGSTASVITQEWCSKLSMVGGTMVLVSVTCAPTVATAVTIPTSSFPLLPTATPFSVVPFAGSSSVGTFAVPSVTIPQSAQPVAQPPPASSVPPVVATITLTVVEVSTLTTCPPSSLPPSAPCPSVVPCPQCPAPTSCPPNAPPGTPQGATPQGPQGPCPGQGYTCNDCPGGWFCPPIQTPAGPAPCGNGWPCYHCSGGWFCAPSPTLAPTTVTICTESPTSTGTAAPARQTPSDGTNPGQQSSSPPEAETTVTSTAFVTVPDASSPSPTYHPAVAGSSYAGCYKDDKSRALKNASITVSVPEGMTNQLCILFCKARGFNLAATEYGFECYCGNVLVDSYLIDDADCNKPCPGDPNCKCGGDWAMSLWTVDGEVPKGFSPKEQFVIPSPAPGQTEIEVNSGGLRQTILVVTTPVYEWPGEAPATASPAATEIDIAGFASSVQAIVSSAMQEAHQIAAAEVSRASSMISGARVGMGHGIQSTSGDGAFPERVAGTTTCSTTITACSVTTTLSTTVTCTEISVIPISLDTNSPTVPTDVLPTWTSGQAPGRVTTVTLNSDSALPQQKGSSTDTVTGSITVTTVLSLPSVSVQPRNLSPPASLSTSGTISTSITAGSQPNSSAESTTVTVITVTKTVPSGIPSGTAGVAPQQQSSTSASSQPSTAASPTGSSTSTTTAEVPYSVSPPSSTLSIPTSVSSIVSSVSSIGASTQALITSSLVSPLPSVHAPRGPATPATTEQPTSASVNPIGTTQPIQTYAALAVSKGSGSSSSREARSFVA